MGAVKEEEEGGGDGPMGRAMKKGPLAELVKKEKEESVPPPTPVPEFKVTKEEHPLGHAW